MLLYGSRLPENPRFAPSFDDVIAGQIADQNAAGRLWDATREVTRFRDNSNAESTAMREAYERRNRSIFEATGVQLDNPYRPGWTEEERERIHRGGGAAEAAELRARAEEDWHKRVRRLAAERPDHADAIGAGRPIAEDAAAIMRAADQEFAAASGAAAELPAWRRFGNVIGGGIAGALRDPLQVATLTLGAAPSGGRLVVGRILQVMLTEAAVNAGVETAVIAASEDWRRRAGLETGTAQALAQVGLAALFGAGFGGLVQGGREVFGALGKAPPAALERAAAGDPLPGDIAEVAAALGRPLDGEQRAVAALAEEQAALDEDAFGPPPAGMTPAEAERVKAEALRAAEDPPDAPAPAPRGPDRSERAEAIERVVSEDTKVGLPPRRPTSLAEFLAEAGGIRDEAGALKAMDLTKRKFRGKRLVRAGGFPLDRAREMAAEAGFFADDYGSAAEAVARSTPNDLIEALDAELAGQPRFSVQEESAVIAAWDAYQARVANRDAYRLMVEDIDGALDVLGIDHRIDDALIRAAARRVAERGDDPVDALEAALEDDYRKLLDAPGARDTGIEDDADFEIPFFDETDGRPGPQAGGPAGPLRAEGAAGDGGTDAGDSAQLPGAGDLEGQAGLRQPGATPEPGTPEAGEIAELALVEATPAGEQTLLGGVAPVTTRERLDAEGAKPMRGGDAPPPEGGLFDEGARDQLDIWDTLPTARTADGETIHTTHADMVAAAERDAFFGDLIASCKD